MQESSSRVLPLSAAAAVMLFGAATAAAGLDSTLPGAPSAWVAVADIAAGWSFAVVGAVLRIRYPASRVGTLAILVGFASFLPDIRWFGTSLTWTLGSVLTDIHLVVLAWLILAFPRGRLGGDERVFVGGVATYFAVLAVAGHLFEEPAPGCGTCPPSVLVIRNDPALSDLIWDVGQVLNLVVIAVLVGLIARKWRRSSPAARRGMSPVVWALGPIGLALALAFLEPLVGFGAAGADAVLIVERLALVVFPLALGVGMVRTRLDHARAADLAASVGRVPTAGDLEGMVAAALGDPSARLGFWSEPHGELIDASGRPLDPDGRDSADIFSRDGERLGAVVYDPAVDPDLVASVGATLTLALRNERLHAELRRQLIEVEASRERIAEAAMAERRRIERDLHDGAQQGLLALGASLGAIRSRSDGEVADLLDEAIADLRNVIDDLRELARGVHPPILAERGLGPAVEYLAERSPVPVRVQTTARRCRQSAEAAAYFLVAEALANATRHTRPTHVDVVVAVEDGWLRVSVSDDGDGGADSEAGSGLQGLADRLEALGGEFRVVSRHGRGTTIEGSLPCG